MKNENELLAFYCKYLQNEHTWKNVEGRASRQSVLFDTITCACWQSSLAKDALE
jgi:hypothetical protein